MSRNQNVSGPLDAPAHARLFEALSDNGFATGLHHARADEITGLQEGLVLHAGAVVFKLSDLFPGGVPVVVDRGQIPRGQADQPSNAISAQRLRGAI